MDRKIRQVAVDTYHDCQVCGGRERCIYMCYRDEDGSRKRIYVGENCFLEMFSEEKNETRTDVHSSVDAPSGGEPDTDAGNDKRPAKGKRAPARRKRGPKKDAV